VRGRLALALARGGAPAAWRASAGMPKSSMTSAETMPNAVRRPNVRMLARSNVASEQKESAATSRRRA
jgi:hypothetical protein